MMVKMALAHRRHDISDHIWLRIEDFLPGKLGKWGTAQKTIEPLSLQYLRSLEQAHHDVICHLISVTGKILTVGSTGGVIKGFEN